MSSLPSSQLRFFMLNDDPQPESARPHRQPFDLTTTLLLLAGTIGAVIALLLLN